jgi:phospholipid/cholesterol/gamma-HCH transport system ATP-binding protein
MRKSLNEMKFIDVSLEFENKQLLLENVNCSFKKGHAYWITGESGSGKSSVLKLLASLEQPSSGQYFINNDNITEMSFEEFVPYRFNIGYSFSSGGVINNRTVYENLILPLNYHNELEPDERHNRVMALLDQFEIAKFAKNRPDEVTGRIKKLISVARTFIFDPEVILLDEPTIGMTPEDVDNLITLMRQSFSRRNLHTAFIVTRHNEFMMEWNPHLIEVVERKIVRKEAA